LVVATDSAALVAVTAASGTGSHRVEAGK
jgi:hypothetical protein